MLALIKRYSLQIIFAISVLFGLQLPSFLQQYEIRLQGHYNEAVLQLEQYQSLANLHSSGDLNTLIKEHRESQSLLFQDEATVIENKYFRVQGLQQKINYLDRPIWFRLAILITEVGQPIFQSTWQSYQANIVLNQESIIVAIIVAILLMLSLEFLLFLSTRFICFLYHHFNKILFA